MLYERLGEILLHVTSNLTIPLFPLKGVSKMSVHSSSTGGDPIHPYEFPQLLSKK